MTVTIEPVTEMQQHFIVSNMRFDSLYEFSQEVGKDIACSQKERDFVEGFRHKYETSWCYDFDMDEYFASDTEKKFWEKVFDEVAERVMEKKIGNPDDHSWRTSLICDAVRISRILHEKTR